MARARMEPPDADTGGAVRGPDLACDTSAKRPLRYLRRARGSGYHYRMPLPHTASHKDSHTLPPGTMLLAASAAAALSVLSTAAGGCTYRADLDFNGGDVAAHVSLANLSSAEARQQRCCALCAADASCKAAVLAGGTHSPPWHCWLKGQGLEHPKQNADVVSCWPAGSTPLPVPPPPPPPAPPAPVPPQCYKAEVVKFDKKPVISSVDGTSSYQQVFNPSWIVASPGTRGKQGLIIRTQNCSASVSTPPHCVACGGTGPKASVLTFSELKGSDNTTSTAPVFAPVTESSVVFGPHADIDIRGTEDPRVAYDPATGIYYMFYTCWSKTGAGFLCLASTRNPTSTEGWTRHGPAFPGNHKSGAMLIRDAPPHYLISGAGEIFMAKSDSLLNWTLGTSFITKTLWGNPHVEAGPPPMLLADGNCKMVMLSRFVCCPSCSRWKVSLSQTSSSTTVGEARASRRPGTSRRGSSSTARIRARCECRGLSSRLFRVLQRSCCAAWRARPSPYGRRRTSRGCRAKRRTRATCRRWRSSRPRTRRVATASACTSAAPTRWWARPWSSLSACLGWRARANKRNKAGRVHPR